MENKLIQFVQINVLRFKVLTVKIMVRFTKEIGVGAFVGRRHLFNSQSHYLIRGNKADQKRDQHQHQHEANESYKKGLEPVHQQFKQFKRRSVRGNKIKGEKNTWTLMER